MKSIAGVDDTESPQSRAGGKVGGFRFAPDRGPMRTAIPSRSARLALNRPGSISPRSRGGPGLEMQTANTAGLMTRTTLAGLGKMQRPAALLDTLEPLLRSIG